VAVVMVMAIFALPITSITTAKLVLSGIVFFCTLNYVGIV
jgi:hypothetical protein